jgi:hypothetical protein
MTATMTHPETAKYYGLYLNPDKKSVTVVCAHSDGPQKEITDVLGRNILTDRETIISTEKNQKAGYALIAKLNRDLSISRYGM